MNASVIIRHARTGLDLIINGAVRQKADGRQVPEGGQGGGPDIEDRNLHIFVERQIFRLRVAARFGHNVSGHTSGTAGCVAELKRELYRVILR